MADAEFFRDIDIYGDGKEKRDVYDVYADQYDDIMSKTGYSAVQEFMANLLSDHMNGGTSLILDIACGTGTSGNSLQQAGFKLIHGTDASAKSLKLAEKKKVYSEVFQGMITKDDRLPCNDSVYDGASCIGSITRGHIEIEPAIEEFCRIVKPGGYAVCTISETKDFMEVLGEFMIAKKIDLILMQRKFFYREEDKDLFCHCCLVKII